MNDCSGLNDLSIGNVCFGSAVQSRPAAPPQGGSEPGPDPDSSFDRYTDHASPFRPRAVVDANTGKTEQFGHRETCECRPVCQSTIRNDSAVRTINMRRNDLPYLLGGFECRVLIYERVKRNMRGSGYASIPLGAHVGFARQSDAFPRYSSLLRWSKITHSGSSMPSRTSSRPARMSSLRFGRP